VFEGVYEVEGLLRRKSLCSSMSIFFCVVEGGWGRGEACDVLALVEGMASMGMEAVGGVDLT
jgi:hypothetical protein